MDRLSDLLYATLSPVYICNLTIYLAVFTYITGARTLFNVLFPLMITNTILEVVLIAFHWLEISRKYKAIPEYAELMELMPNSVVAYKILYVLLHVAPIIVFVYLDVIKECNMTGMTLWLAGLGLMSIYFLAMVKSGLIYEYYGHGRKLAYMAILYPIILFCVCNILYK